MEMGGGGLKVRSCWMSSRAAVPACRSRCSAGCQLAEARLPAGYNIMSKLQ